MATGKRLESWKEIAEHLRRGVTTVQRWEREEGLPIHRHVHGTGGSVFAFADDLDRWRTSREPSPLGVAGGPAIAPSEDVWETPGGAMPLGSPFYISRGADDEFREAVARRSSIVLVKGARQAGKSSLLARALADARLRRAAVAFTDVQALGHDDLRSPTAFYQALGRSIAEQTKVSSSIRDGWNDNDSPNTNFSRYVQRVILAGPQHVVWGLDEVDRLVGRDFAVDVFGLFRSWHNRRALDPAASWGRLTLAIAYATEAHLLIADVNQSPFNVGIRVALEDFTAEDVMTLNERYGSLLDGAAAVARLMTLVGGHPYLLQCAFERGAARRDARSCRRRRATGGRVARRTSPPAPRGAAARTGLEQAMAAVVKQGRCPGPGHVLSAAKRRVDSGRVAGRCPAAVRALQTIGLSRLDATHR